MRRWAKANGKTEHKALKDIYDDLLQSLSSGDHLPDTEIAAAEDQYGHEAEVKLLLVRHRKREAVLRSKKIASALDTNNGRLICEVPHCGFEFRATYGELGVGFAEVHHLKPLSEAPANGRSVRLSELAVVCANCHRMIHRNGQNRPLQGLIPQPTHTGQIRPIKAKTR
ncbi:HNH endonuclease [Rhodoplanes sp. SY1]|uniref:HNH endonuclease n=1 Tax=Rhodoplanes sp. SY1 TaxID=3166646 RepID=UPI0038B49627